MGVTGASSALLILTLLIGMTGSGCAAMRRRETAPDSVAACRQLSREGAAALERGAPAEARDLLEQAVATSPSDLEARRQLAEALWQSGSRQEAVVQMEAAVRLDPRHAATLVRSGEMLLSLGAADRALARAEEAIAQDAAAAGAWTLRGRVFRHTGQLDRSLADLHQALRYNPGAVDVLVDAGEVQLQLGRPERCLSTLHQALDADPQGPHARRALWLSGLAYSALNRPDDAVESLYAASTRGEPQPTLLYELARAQQAAGRVDEATVTARQALAADGHHAASRELLARLEGVDVPVAEAPIRR